MSGIPPEELAAMAAGTVPLDDEVKGIIGAAIRGTLQAAAGKRPPGTTDELRIELASMVGMLYARGVISQLEMPFALRFLKEADGAEIESLFEPAEEV